MDSSTQCERSNDSTASDIAIKSGRLKLGLDRAQGHSGHPHAIVEDAEKKRNAQEGAVEVPKTPQQPNSVVEEAVPVEYDGKVEWMSVDDE